MFYQLLITFTGLIVGFCYTTSEAAKAKCKLATFTEVSTQPNYSIEVKYPKLSGLGNEDIQQSVNQQIKMGAVQEVRTFIQDIRAAYALDKTLFTEQKSSLTITTEIGLFNEKVLSFALIAVHKNAAIDYPQYFHHTYTFDLQNGKLLNLAQLFKKDGYLSLLSNYSFKEIKQQHQSENIPINNSQLQIKTISKADNFKNFVLQSNHLQLYFNSYALENRYNPSVRVSIPYHQLALYLKEFSFFPLPKQSYPHKQIH